MTQPTDTAPVHHQPDVPVRSEPATSYSSVNVAMTIASNILVLVLIFIFFRH